MSSSLTATKIKNVISECELHQKRIEYALEKLKKFMPLDAEKYKVLNDEQVEALDQFLFRFSKLQDSIGQRLFSYLLEAQEEPVKHLSFLDKLNRLEQLGIIPDKDQWLNIRNLRNKVSHEYEDDPFAMCNALNLVYASYTQLATIFLQVKQSFSQ
ncbi:MAG: hypothetical protein KBD83_02025 [Gammaproteobacteria bacterium]|nr:hypothetical protein [Gammaproteobacteria bacterium]